MEAECCWSPGYKGRGHAFPEEATEFTGMGKEAGGNPKLAWETSWKRESREGWHQLSFYLSCIPLPRTPGLVPACPVLPWWDKPQPVVCGWSWSVEVGVDFFLWPCAAPCPASVSDHYSLQISRTRTGANPATFARTNVLAFCFTAGGRCPGWGLTWVRTPP